LARAWFGPGAKGPPAHAHGGSIASLLDEAMGCCAWNSGHPVLAAKITVSFRRSLPLGRIYMAEAWIERATGRKFSLVGRLSDDEGVVYAESEGLFVELNGEQRTQMMAYREAMEKEGL
jgi:acyl-coenzyme A thioesterase PaaI-like protein